MGTTSNLSNAIKDVLILGFLLPEEEKTGCAILLTTPPTSTKYNCKIQLNLSKALCQIWNKLAHLREINMILYWQSNKYLRAIQLDVTIGHTRKGTASNPLKLVVLTLNI